MASNDILSMEATISAPVSDNDNDPQTTIITLPTQSSDDGAQTRVVASGGSQHVTIMVTENGAEVDENTRNMENNERDDEEEEEKENRERETEERHRPVSFMRIPKLKREKSYSETLERKKKRVKFSSNDDDDVIVDTRVFEPIVVNTGEGDEDKDDNVLSSKIKKLLKKRSKKKKSTIETQTEDDDKVERGEETTIGKEESDKEKRLEEGGTGEKEEDAKVPEGGNVLPSTVNTRWQEDFRTNDAKCDRMNRAISPDEDESDARAFDDSPSLRGLRDSSSDVSGSDVSSVSANTDTTTTTTTTASIETSVVSVPCPQVHENQVVSSTNIYDRMKSRCLSSTERNFESVISEKDEIYDYWLNRGCPANECDSSDDRQKYEHMTHQMSPLLEEQEELEICSYRLDDDNSQGSATLIENDNSVCGESNTAQESWSSAPSQATVKREGTFTLDGPPPAKITKPSSDAEEGNQSDVETTPSRTTPPRDAIMEPLNFFVRVDNPKNIKKSSVPSGVPSKGVEKKENENNSNKSAKCHHQPSRNSLKVAKSGVGNSKSNQEDNSAVTSLKNTARRTFVSAWRTATKSHEPQGQPQNPTKKSKEEVPAVTTPRSSPTKLHQQQRQEKSANPTAKSKSDRKTPKQVTPVRREVGRSSQRPETSSKSSHEKNSVSVWAGVSLPSFKREGTFTKKYDSERDRLQAECNKLNVEKDRLQSELLEARTRLEEEAAARKALRRDNELHIRHLREDALKKTEILLTDLRNRLEDEKREALAQQKETLSRNHDHELLRADKERDEDHRRLQQEARATEDRLKAELRRETTKPEPAVKCCHHCAERDIDRLSRELATLREHKKRLEDAVQTLQESERKRAGELRRLHEEHEAEISKIHKTNKCEAARLLDELRAKDRTIGNLERQVSVQSAKLRLHEEKQREGSSDRADSATLRRQTSRGGGSGVSSKRQKECATTKDGRPRDKECSSSSSPPSNNNIISHIVFSSSSSIVNSSSSSGSGNKFCIQHQPIASHLRRSRSVEPESSKSSSPQHNPSPTMTAEITELRRHVEDQKQQIEQHLQQIAQQRQQWEEQRQQMLEQLAQQEDTLQEERQKYEQQIVQKTHLVEEQKEVMQAQKQVMEEQQLRILDLTHEAMERECMDMGPPQHTWPPRRESCVKVCELPTVLEQASDDENSANSSPTYTPTPTTPPSPSSSFPALHDPCPPTLTITQPTSPTPFLTPTTPGTNPPVWPEVTENAISNQYAQLSREHQELQRSYQLLASASSPSVELVAKDGPSEWWSAARVMELEGVCATLKAELQETRDHADLLEFRILELTEGADKISEEGEEKETCDQSTATDFDDISIPTPNEDLSLPLSIDSGLDLSSDYKRTRVSEGRAWLAQLPECPASQQLGAFLDWVAALPTHPHHALTLPMSPTLPNPTPPSASTTTTSSNNRGGGTMGVEEVGGDIGRDLIVLATRLQESLSDPVAQEPVLLDTITKLRVLDSSLSELQERVVSLTEENRELQEVVTSLSEAHETRTEASGTESEIVHRKTPSIHSDLSDAESDSPEHAQHRVVTSLDAATSFQESGIFDTSCELVHVTTQTDLESDEYLKMGLDDERVTLSKLEYDSIVEGDRCLQQELDHLKCEKNQLLIDCENLKEQIISYRASRGTDAEEALKGEIRVLKQRLSVSERARQEVFDEKCELEEEENDSRLMVQRLESQLEAAREMENLLSASLSQEQEISRELHRRVRDLQILEKDHRGRLDKLEFVARSASEKATSLGQARDALATQLSFAAYGLLMADYWRLTVPQSTAALIPYSNKMLKVSSGICPTKPFFEGSFNARDDRPHENVSDVSVCPPVVCDVCVQTCCDSPSVNAGVQTQVDSHCVGVQCQDDFEVSNTRSDFEHGKCRSAERDEDEPITKKPRTRSQATMTLYNDDPTEREQYYLEQIEALQKEKRNLRKGQDSDRRDSLQQCSDLESALEEMRHQIAEAERDKCNLLFRLEETQDERDEAKHNLLLRIEELKGDMTRYNDLYELEKKALRRDYEARLAEAEKEHNRKEERIRQLELQLSTFRQELEIVGVSIANDLVSFDSDMENVLTQGGKSSTRNGDGDNDLLEKIRELVKSETTLRQKISDLEKKECAYRETIREADKIMSSHVTSYKQRIEDLEATIDQQAQRVQQLESSEERLRATLRNNSRTSEGARISDLLDRLIDTENSELKLKERVWGLERSEKELQIKLMEGEKTNQSLRAELRDQEELVHRLMTLESENNALSVELNQAQDSARKISEVQQSESYLRGRVEELEVTENMLRETLHQADLILAQREKKFRDQISCLQEEVLSYKAQLEAAASKEFGAKESEVFYRKQLEELRSRLADAERELKESSSETMSHETQHRSEVTKLRNQLKLSNSQLTELDRLNCELRDRVMAAEAEGQRLAKELEEHARRHEQDLLNFNLQVSSRDSRLQDLESQLEQMSQATAASELDALASSPIAALHSSITTLTNTLKNCESCSEAQGNTLMVVTTQLSTLAELLEGRSNNSDMEDFTSDTDEEETIYADTAENLANEATTTPPPNPAGEGLREHSSGDATNCTLVGRFQRDIRRKSRRRLEERNSRRLARPQGSSTILEELEEKVRELEEAVGRKEEELRLADIEANELNSQLQSRDAVLTLKSEEIEHLNTTLANLRQQLVHTMEDYERARLSLQAKHKVDLEELTRRVEQLTEEAERLANRGKLKDSIISTLASQIRAILRSGNMSIVVNQLRHLRTSGPSKDSSISDDEPGIQQPDTSSLMPAVPDFDVDTVCSLLSQPNEMASLSQSAILNGVEPSSHVTLASETLLTLSFNGRETTSHVTCQGSPTLVQRRKSRIPRYLPSPVTNTKTTAPVPLPNTKTTAPVPLPVAKPINNMPKQMMADPNLMPEKILNSVSELRKLEKATIRSEMVAKSVRDSSMHAVKPALLTERKAPTVSEPVQKAMPKPMLRRELQSTPPKPTTPVLKPVATSTPAKPTARKEPTRRERPATTHLSDARKIKRMVTGMAPLHAAIECASAPEWQTRSSPQSSTSSEVEATCIPRPQGLHITRRVGVDGVVIAWEPLEHDCVAGFQILVGGRVVQHVRSPHRTKALVTGLPLAGAFTIGLVTMAEDGRCSTPVIVTQDRSRVYPGKSVSANRPLRRAVPTCL